MDGEVKIEPGLNVQWAGMKFVISSIVDPNSVLITNISNGEIKRISISELTFLKDKNEEPKSQDISTITESEWKKAQKRFEIIKPLLDEKVNGIAFKDRAKEYGTSVVTIYRWRTAYQKTGKLSSLIDTKRSGGFGKSRLENKIEEIVNSTISQTYLTSQRKSINHTIHSVLLNCRKAGLKAPHPNTIRRRINSLSEYTIVKSRLGSRIARERFAPKAGMYNEASFPLAIVQIDHTELDIILVDDIHRQPLGRPWITVGIDLFSRMVTGFSIAMEPPGALSTGICLANSILPKEKWLSKNGISSNWPVWGVMKKIHLDNAREFHGNMLKMACDEYGIDIEWRPIQTPHYGGHIESLLGTFLSDIHNLSGTTFSNPEERGTYDSKKNAIFSLSEFEKWFLTYVTEVYHQRLHSGILMSPIKKWEEGILGKDGKTGIGIPPRILDENRLRMDFMPFIKRSVHPFGVIFERIHYFDNILRPYIKSNTDPALKKQGKQLFRIDPRDMSTIFFYDPENKQYYPINYRDISRPPMSIWELRKITKKIMAEGRSEINEEMIFNAYEKLISQEETAKKLTKRTRLSARREKIGLTQKAKEQISENEIKQYTSVEAKNHKKITPFPERILREDE